MFFSTALAGQVGYFNYIPLEFRDVEPLWIHVTSDSTIIGAETGNAIRYDGHSHVHNTTRVEDSFIIHDDFIYVVTPSRFDGDFSGGIIEKIDLYSGEMIWKNTFDYRNTEYREDIRRAVIKNNKLVIYTYRIVSDEVEEFPLPIIFLGAAEGFLKIREYDLSNGELIYQSEPDLTDPNNKIIPNEIFGGQQLHFISEDSFLLLEKHIDTTGSYFITDTIDAYGRLLNDPDTTLSCLEIDDWGDSYWRDSHLYRIDPNGKLYWLDFYIPGDFTLDTARAFINVYDHGVITEKLSLNFLDKDNASNWNLIDVTDAYIYLQVSYFGENGQWHVILDKEGKLIKKVKDEGQLSTYSEMDEDYNFILGRTSGFVDGSYPNGHSQLSLYRSQGERMEKISTFTFAFPSYMIELTRVKKLSDDNYLVSGIYYEVEINRRKGRFNFMMKLTPEMMGLETVNTMHIIAEKDQLRLYPNPGSSILTLELEKPSNINIKVFNSNNQFMFQKIENTTSMKIDINHLEPGFYYLIANINGQTKRKRFVKI